jgi:hypothetical protein
MALAPEGEPCVTFIPSGATNLLFMVKRLQTAPSHCKVNRRRQRIMIRRHKVLLFACALLLCTSNYYDRFYNQAGATLIRQLSDAATNLGSYWLTSWINAGRPALPR